MSKKQWVINKRLFEFLVKISIYTHVSPKFSRNISIFLHDWFMCPSARNHVDRTFGLATSHDCLPTGGPSICLENQRIYACPCIYYISCWLSHQSFVWAAQLPASQIAESFERLMISHASL